MPEFLNNVGKYISTNPKDFVNICFLIITGILAFLTYKNAKKTLFNPIRSEMVKYQMKVITEFIDNHTSKGFDFETSIDYSNLLKLNYETDYLFDILTNEQKFEQHQFDELDANKAKFCRENLGGLFEMSTQHNNLHLELVYGDFDIVKQYVQTKYIKVKEQSNPELLLQRFYLSRKFYSFFKDLMNLKTNPFVPNLIKAEIKIIISNIYKNVTILYQLLSTHISQQTDTTYQNIYSQFLEKKIDHQIDLEKLRDKISNYFKVNEI